MKRNVLLVLIGLLAGVSLAMFLAASPGTATSPPPSKDVQSTYYPNTEVLAKDEIRVIALGTGLPTPLTAKQKSSAWLVECGNGDKFLFDCGTGSAENMFGLQIDFLKTL